ncbi:MAG: hypothetical protein M1822_009769 [Bathelium mastoideum]|nr:MAG: hypothetical protein M1822_009769 [Bathelium mastoideum]
MPNPLQDSEIIERKGILPSHFINHVAKILMPFGHEHNPWHTCIPEAAFGISTPALDSPEQKSLHHAILALAATHVIQKGTVSQQDVHHQESMHYGIATSELAQSIATSNRDYGTFMAAVMTMMMIEIFRGHSGRWRTHLHGAWDFIRTPGSTIPHDSLSLAATQIWYTSAILCESSILCIELPPPEAGPGSKIGFEQAILKGIGECPVLGFPLGANATIMGCVIEIQRLKALLQTNAITVEDLEQKSEDIRSRLGGAGSPGDELAQPSATSAKVYAEHHISAFRHAALIYLARVTQDAAPCMLSGHVAEVYRNVEAYYQTGGHNFAVWPCFLAAAEAYDESHITAARSWLEKARHVGMGNREHLSSVLEEIWRRRSVESMLCDLEPGLITIDWREVMSDLQLDVLLI